MPVSLRAHEQSWLHAGGVFLHPGGISGWEDTGLGQVLVSHTWVQASAALHAPTPSAPCFVPRNPGGKARVGCVGTLAEQRGGKISAAKPFPCRDTGPAAEPSWQDT